MLSSCNQVRGFVSSNATKIVGVTLVVCIAAVVAKAIFNASQHVQSGAPKEKAVVQDQVSQSTDVGNGRIIELKKMIGEKTRTLREKTRLKIQELSERISLLTSTIQKADRRCKDLMWPLHCGLYYRKSVQEGIALDKMITDLKSKRSAAEKELQECQSDLVDLLATPLWDTIDSSQLIEIGALVRDRSDFLTAALPSKPPVISKSPFVSDVMVNHLMRNKKDLALGVKYEEGDAITNMEAALHTFVTPVAGIVMTGDYSWFGKAGGMQGNACALGHARPVILSALIQPDFECSGRDEVMMAVCKARDEEVLGQEFDTASIPSREDKKDLQKRVAYDHRLLKHMVYHLSSQHKILAKQAILPGNIMTQADAEAYLQALLNESREPDFVGKFVRIGGELVSLEILFNMSRHQVLNEFRAIHSNTPQGYVYTIDPPQIFVQQMGNAKILNRLQALAIRSLAKTEKNLFSRLKMIAMNDYADPSMIGLMQKAVPVGVVVQKKSLLFQNGSYVGPRGLALVMHNNSDGFGQNIEFEGASSLDGVIGSYSNAALVLKRDRPDLLANVM